MFRPILGEGKQFLGSDISQVKHTCIVYHTQSIQILKDYMTAKNRLGPFLHEEI